MKMLVKLSKNPNATLRSDAEEKGKGKRLKKMNKRFVDSDNEQTKIPKKRVEQKRVETPLPPFPTYTPKQLPDKETAVNKRPCEGVSRVKPTTEGSVHPTSSKSAFKKGCKIHSTKGFNHKCAYTEEGHVTLESLADAVCSLSGMLNISFNYIGL